MVKIPRRLTPDPDEPDDFDEIETETPATKELADLMDDLLDAARPREIYTADEHDWQESVIDKVTQRAREQIERTPDADPLRDLMTTKVRRREAESCKRANRSLRKLSEPDTLDLEIFTDMLTERVRAAPISLGNGRRVRFGEAREADLTEWILASSDASDKRGLAEAQARDGATRLRDALRSSKRRNCRVDDLLR